MVEQTTTAHVCITNKSFHREYKAWGAVTVLWWREKNTMAEHKTTKKVHGEQVRTCA